MFVNFYGMLEQPFGVTPDSRYLYLGHAHREALASLYCGILDRRGFLALIAPPGTGKTTLLFYLLARLRVYARTVFLFDTPSNPEDLMSCLAADIGVNTSGLNNTKSKEHFYTVVSQEARVGRSLVIVADEAQHLPTPVLEKLRLLSNFESQTQKLVQVVLAGQPQLATRLAHPELSQLQQRLAMTISLEPFSADQVSRYIYHRLHVAGYSGNSLFTRDALAGIARESQGIPRAINILCYNALALGCARRQKCIHADLITEVARDLNYENQAHHKGTVAPCSREEHEQPHRSDRPRYLLAKSTARQRGTRPHTSAHTIGTQFSIFVKGAALLAILGISIPVGTLSHISETGWSPSRPSAVFETAIPVSRRSWVPDFIVRSYKPLVVTAVDYWSDPTFTTVGVTFDEPVIYEVHRLTSPDRVYVDFYGTRLAPALLGKRFQVDDKVLKTIRISERRRLQTRITLETYGRCELSVTMPPDRSGLRVRLRKMQNMRPAVGVAKSE